MTSNCTTMTGPLQISLREIRLMLDRVLLNTGLPSGFNAAVRECVLVSEACRAAGQANPGSGWAPGGLTRFMAIHDTFSRARPDALQIVVATETPSPRIDCAGQHAWIVAQMLLDLLLAEHAERNATSMSVVDVAEPAELRTLVWLAQRHGATIRVETEPAAHGAGGATLTLIDRRLPPKDAADDLLRGIIRQGLPVDSALWWSIYHLAAGALTPDNVISRRHAGANIVGDKGEIIGRPTDDDTDFSLLTKTGDAGTASNATPGKPA